MAKSSWSGSPEGVPLSPVTKPIAGGGSGSGVISGVLSANVSTVSAAAHGTLSSVFDTGSGVIYPGKYSGFFGAFEIGINGVWKYTLDVTNADVLSLSGARTKTDRIPVIACSASGICATEISITVKSPGAFSYSQVVLADEPRMYWRLGETSGSTAFDASGNEFNGTYYYDASALTAAGLLSGDADAAIEVKKSVAGVSLAGVPIDTGMDWSCEVIIKPSAAPPQSGVGVLWQIGDNGNYCPEIDVIDRGSGTFGLRVMQSGVREVFQCAASFSYGQRVHVVLTHSAANAMALYLNGVLDTNSGLSSYGHHSAVTRLGFGKFAGEAYPCQGFIDEAALYQKVLSAERVAAHFAAI